jgi:hypothetical protein
MTGKVEHPPVRHTPRQQSCEENRPTGIARNKRRRTAAFFHIDL